MAFLKFESLVAVSDAVVVDAFLAIDRESGGLLRYRFATSKWLG